MDTYSKIRKLRKKLRQIEHLEHIERDLTEEEVLKCMKKESVREELLELLVAYNSQKSADETETDIDTSVATSVTDISTPVVTDFSPTENINNSSESGAKHDTIPLERSIPKSTQNPVPEKKDLASENGELKSECNTSRTEKSQSSNITSTTKKTKTKKGEKDTTIRAEWNTKTFLVTVLQSHNDLITAVDCCDDLLVSASRDTTVKIWDIESLTELRSLGSHTGSVTDVVVLPGKIAATLGASLTISEDDHLILSGSTDCSLNVWLASTGELLKSVYTYNPITKVAFYPELSLVATASDGGKLELWNIDSKENVCSETAHSDSITGLCVSDGRIYTSCAINGEIKVFEVRDCKLHCIFVSETLRTMTADTVTMRHVRSLGVRGEIIYYGDDGVNLKLLSWRKGLIKKLANHKEEFGMTDAICCHGNLMLTSAYDLDSGHGYVNVFDLSAEPCYVTTLDCEETRRILDISCSINRNGGITIATAGLDLQVWKQVTSGRKDKDSIETDFIQGLSQPAQDSDIESDVEFTDSESEGGSNRSSRRGSTQSQKTGWMSWCTLT